MATWKTSTRQPLCMRLSAGLAASQKVERGVVGNGSTLFLEQSPGYRDGLARMTGLYVILEI
jgi:hypothetical protein